MHRIYFLITTILCLSTIGQAQTSSEWEGTYTGSVFGSYSTLTSRVNGSQWSGTIDVEEGYPLQMEGSVNGEECTGTLRDEKQQKSTAFTATHAGNQITISMRETNPLTGYEEDMYFSFSKETPFHSEPPLLNTDPPVTRDPNTVLLDKSLFGVWYYEDTEVSGGFMTSKYYYMQFFENGEMLFTDGRAEVDEYMDELYILDPDTHHNNWKIDRQIIWTLDNKNQWEPYAKYNVESGTLLLIFSNQKKEVWEQW